MSSLLICRDQGLALGIASSGTGQSLSEEEKRGLKASNIFLYGGRLEHHFRMITIYHELEFILSGKHRIRIYHRASVPGVYNCK
jgi:hypothetical protein